MTPDQIAAMPAGREMDENVPWALEFAYDCLPQGWELAVFCGEGGYFLQLTANRHGWNFTDIDSPNYVEFDDEGETFAQRVIARVDFARNMEGMEPATRPAALLSINPSEARNEDS